MKICIYGSSSDKVDDVFFVQAEKLADNIIINKHEIICGGGKSGPVGCFARAYITKGGHVTGIAPKSFVIPNVLLENCSDLIITEDVNSRIDCMVAKSDCFILLPGGIGTFEEFFSTLSANMLGEISKPIILFNINSYYTPLLHMLNESVSSGFSSKSIFEFLYDCSCTADVISALNNISANTPQFRSILNYHE